MEFFTHSGGTENIKQTIHNIYKDILPNSNLTIKHYSETGFIHLRSMTIAFAGTDRLRELTFI